MSEEDEIENVIGRFGKYQISVFILLMISRFPTDYQLINVVFVIPQVEHMCLDEEANNQTGYCPCKNPQYDLSEIGSSVTSTFDLICDKRHLASLAQSTLQVGILVGSLVYGYLSDRFGRRIAVYAALLSEVLFVSISAAVTQFWMFVAMRFLMGTAVGGTMLCVYILLVELSGKSFRPYLSGLADSSLIVSYITLPFIASSIRDWRNLQLASSLPWLYIAVIIFFLPESPRWLITTGKKERAVEMLTHIAKRHVNISYYSTAVPASGPRNNRPTENIINVVDKLYEESLSNKQNQHGSYIDLFKTRSVSAYSLIIAFIWISCTHTFFGINQYIGRLEGNIYINVMFSSIGLIPGTVLSICAAVYLKRRLSVALFCGVAAVSLLFFIFIPSNMNNVVLVFAIIGQAGAFATFSQVYLFSSEIFPTVVRNSAMGFASMCGRFGGFIAPFVVNIGTEWVSIIIFSIILFLAAASCYFLPETRGIVLVNRIPESEKSKRADP